jgi:hypothetical protein
LTFAAVSVRDVGKATSLPRVSSAIRAVAPEGWHRPAISQPKACRRQAFARSRKRRSRAGASSSCSIELKKK